MAMLWIHRELLLLFLNAQFVYYIKNTIKMLLPGLYWRTWHRVEAEMKKTAYMFGSCCVIYTFLYREWLTSLIRRIQYGHDNASFHSLFTMTIQVAVSFVKQCLEWLCKRGSWEKGGASDVRNKTSSIVTMATQCDSLTHSFTIIFYIRRCLRGI